MSHGFFPALFDAGKPPPESVHDGAARAAGRRFDVYRNNVAYSLTRALHSGFPTVTRLIGPQNMDRLAGVFLRAHPPSSPLMMFYGAQFPEFLAIAGHLAHLPCLADVARLDLAVRRAYHAGDATPMRADDLSQIAPETLVGATATLAPAVHLLRSDWPIHDIRQGNCAPARSGPAQDVLITRPDFDPVVQPLPPGAAAWVQGLMDGLSLGDALDTALAQTPQFDMGAPLSLLLLGGALVSLD